MGFDVDSWLKDNEPAKADLPFGEGDYKTKRDRAQQWDSYIDLFAKDHPDLPDLPNLARAVLMREWNPKKNVSDAGATGLMQVMPATFAGHGGKNIDDPVENIEVGVNELADQYRRFGTPELALAAYNAGPGAVRKHKGIPPFKETQEYVPAVMGYYNRLTQKEEPTPDSGKPFNVDSWLADNAPLEPGQRDPTLMAAVDRSAAGIDAGTPSSPGGEPPPTQYLDALGPEGISVPGETAADRKKKVKDQQVAAINTAKGAEFAQAQAAAPGPMAAPIPLPGGGSFQPLTGSKESLTPEAYQREKMGEKPGVKSTLADLYTAAGNVGETLGNIIDSKPQMQAYGERMTATENAVTDKRRRAAPEYQAALKTATQKLKSGAQQTDEDKKILAENPGFTDQLREAGKAVVTQEFWSGMAKQMGKDFPLLFLGDEALAGGLDILKTGFEAYKAGKSIAYAAKLAEDATKARLAKPGALAMAGSGAAGAGRSAATNVALGELGAAEQGRDMGLGEAATAAAQGAAFHFLGEPAKIIRAVRDPRPTLPQLMENPAIAEMLPKFQALMNNPETSSLKWLVKPRDPGKMFMSREDLDRAGYPHAEPGDYDIAGAYDAKTGTATIRQTGGPETVVEEVAHFLQDRIRRNQTQFNETGDSRFAIYTDLHKKITDWEAGVRAQAKKMGVTVPAGDELLGQVFTAHMGYADKYPDAVNRIVLPDEILDDMAKLIGAGPDLGGAHMPERAPGEELTQEPLLPGREPKPVESPEEPRTRRELPKNVPANFPKADLGPEPNLSVSALGDVRTADEGVVPPREPRPAPQGPPLVIPAYILREKMAAARRQVEVPPEYLPKEQPKPTAPAAPVAPAQEPIAPAEEPGLPPRQPTPGAEPGPSNFPPQYRESVKIYNTLEGNKGRRPLEPTEGAPPEEPGAVAAHAEKPAPRGPFEAQRARVAKQLDLPEEHPAITRAITDPLTGLLNQGTHLEDVNDKTLGAGHASMDVSGLKFVNDTFGHPAGNDFLRIIGEEAKKVGEETGTTPYRTGGDEFGFRAGTEGEARAAASLLKERLKSVQVHHTDPATGKKVTVADGIRLDYGYGKSFEEADTHLDAYRARAELLPPGHPERRVPYRTEVPTGERRGSSDATRTAQPEAGRDVQLQPPPVKFDPQRIEQARKYLTYGGREPTRADIKQFLTEHGDKPIPQRLGLSLAKFRQAEKFLTTADRAPTESEVVKFLRELGDEPVPEKTKRASSQAMGLVERRNRSQEIQGTDQLLRAGDPSLKTDVVKGAALGDTFESGGLQFKRVKTRDPAVIRFKDPKGTTYDFRPDEDVHTGGDVSVEPPKAKPVEVGDDDVVPFQLKKSKPAAEAGIPKGKENDPQALKAAAKAWKEKGVESPFFKRWFGESKVVDEKGQPIIAYHGSPVSHFERFDPKMRGGMGGPLGFWFATTGEAASQFARHRYAGEAPGVYPVHLSIQKPMEYHGWKEFTNHVEKLRNGGAIEKGMKSLRKGLESRGYDGVVIRDSETDMGGRRDDWVAFEPEQIKSATGNRGTFNPESPDIRYQLKRSKVQTEQKDIFDNRGHVANQGFIKSKPGDKGAEGTPLFDGPEREAQAKADEQQTSLLQLKPSRKPGEPVPEVKRAKEIPFPRPKNSAEGAFIPPDAGDMSTPREAGSGPRIDERVQKLREAEADAGLPPAHLDRETKRTWAGMEPEVQDLLKTQGMEYFEKATQKGPLEDYEQQALDSIVKGKYEDWQKAQTEFAHADPKSRVAKEAESLAAAAEYAAAGLMQVNNLSKTGRALAAAARIMKRARAVEPLALMRMLAKAIPDVGQKDLATLLHAWQNHPEQFPDLLRAYATPGLAAKVGELYRAGLLSGISTHIRNVAGNTADMAVRLAETPLAAAWDRTFSAIYKGEKRTRYLAETHAEAIGLAQAAPAAIRNFATGLRTLFKDERIDPLKKVQYQVGNIGSGKPGALRSVEKAAGRYYTRPIFKLLALEDAMARDIGGNADMHRLAVRKAISEGKTGKDIHTRADKILADGQSKHPELFREVRKLNDERVFQEQLGKNMQALSNIANNSVLGFVLPFVKTPYNLMRRTFQRSPLGFIKASVEWKAWRKAVADGAPKHEVEALRGHVMDLAARATAGSAILAGATAMAATGIIGMTGGGPKKYADKKLQMDSKWQPYSFFFSYNGEKHYVPYAWWEPVSSLLQVAADIAESHHPEGMDYSNLVQKVGSDLLSKTYVTSLNDAFQFATDISNGNEGPMAKFASNWIASWVPSIVGRAAQAIDPVMRDTKPEASGFAGLPELTKNAVESRIPGLSENLPPKYSTTGSVMERNGSALGRFASPAVTSDENAPREDLVSAILKTGYRPPAIPYTVKGEKGQIRLTREDRAALAAAHDRVSKMLERRVRTPYWQTMSAEDQADEMKSEYQDARNEILDRIKDRP